MGTAVVVNMAAVGALTDGESNVVHDGEMLVIEDTGKELIFEEDGFVYAADSRRANTVLVCVVA